VSIKTCVYTSGYIEEGTMRWLRVSWGGSFRVVKITVASKAAYTSKDVLSSKRKNLWDTLFERYTLRIGRYIVTTILRRYNNYTLIIYYFKVTTFFLKLNIFNSSIYFRYFVK